MVPPAFGVSPERVAESSTDPPIDTVGADACVVTVATLAFTMTGSAAQPLTAGALLGSPEYEATK